MVMFYAFPKIGMGLPEYLYNHKSPRCEMKKTDAGGPAVTSSAPAEETCPWKPAMPASAGPA